jgi:hypothetical protein
MNAQRIQELLHGLLDEIACMDEEDMDNAGLSDTAILSEASVSTFGEAGLLTSDAGIVLRLEDGTEFQLTIVQSRRAA